MRAFYHLIKFFLYMLIQIFRICGYAECLVPLLKTRQNTRWFLPSKSQTAIQTSTQANWRAFVITSPTQGAIIETFKQPQRSTCFHCFWMSESPWPPFSPHLHQWVACSVFSLCLMPQWVYDGSHAIKTIRQEGGKPVGHQQGSILKCIRIYLLQIWIIDTFIYTFRSGVSPWPLKRDTIHREVEKSWERL